LQLYGLYRRSKDGVAPATKPDDDSADDKQWKAWQDFGSISTVEAMKRFITTIFSLRPDWDYKAK
jgi:acyl-CoA-binding protein